MDNIKNEEYKTFEDIKNIDVFGNEYWDARKLQIVLQYTRWEKFSNVIEKAKKACKNSGYAIENGANWFWCTKKKVRL